MRHLLAILLLASFASASKTTLTGTLTDSQGTGMNGTLVMTLPVPAQDTTTNTAVAPGPVLFRLANGAISGGAQLYDVLNLQPGGLYYQARAFDTAGNLQFYGNYIVTGGTFNLGSATPTSVTTSNISYSGVGFTGLNNIWTGQNTFNGLTILSLLGGATVFADSPVYTGSDASCKIGSAITALPAAGGTVDARNLNDVGGLGACVVDPGTKIITLLLGPYTYTMRLKLRTNFHVFGFGAFSTGTLIQAPDTTNDVISLGGTAPSAGVVLDGFRVYCGAGNTIQKGIDIVAQSGGGGLWYSDIRNVIVGTGDGATGVCGGGAWIFDGNSGGSPPGINQFLKFTNVVGYRKTNSGNPALLISGLNGQFAFDGASQFDGPTVHDTNQINVLIKDGTQTVLAPYTISFVNMTSQHAWGATGVALQLQGTTGVICHPCHFEDDNGGVNEVVGAAFGNWGNKIEGSFFATGTGIDGGNGWIVKMDVNSSLAFDDNQIFGTPDAFTLGNTKFFSSKGNMNFSSGSAYGKPFNYTLMGGVNNDGSGFKHIRGVAGCATAAAVGAACTTTVTWTTAFPDANYTAQCGGRVVTSGIPVNGGLTAQIAASVTFQTVATTAAAAQYTNIDCIAVHD